MATYNTNEFKNGLKLLLDGAPCSIIENEFVKPGKGHAFLRVKYRNLKTGRVLERKFRSGESVEAAEVLEREMQFLYQDDETWHFMDPVSYEQISAGSTAMAEAVRWLKGQEICRLIVWEGKPISVLPPQFVVLRVRESAPGVRGDTATSGNKPATLESGVVIRVPLFVEQGESVKVDTRNGLYMGRASEKGS